jgi:hypothetical protein
LLKIVYKAKTLKMLYMLVACFAISLAVKGIVGAQRDDGCRALVCHSEEDDSKQGGIGGVRMASQIEISSAHHLRERRQVL